MSLKISPARLKIVHLALIAYFTYFFLGLINSGPLIFGHDGLFSDYIHPLSFLNPIKDFTNWQYNVYFIILTLSSFLLLTNRWFVYLWIWLNWTFLITCIPFYIPPPQIGYLGFLLLCLTQIDFAKKQFKFSWFKTGLWWVLGLSYTASGVGKYFSHTWESGLTITTILNSALGQENFLTAIVLWLPLLGTLFSIFALVGELLSAPLMIFAKTRFWGWLVMVLVHFGIFSFLNIQDIPLGMLIFHLFIFDDYWFKPSSPPELLIIGEGKLINFLQKEDIFNIIKYSPGSDFMVYLNHKPLSKTKGFLIALSYTNGFWRWLKLFIK